VVGNGGPSTACLCEEAPKEFPVETRSGVFKGKREGTVFKGKALETLRC